jgi:glucose-6-phosphate 1-epimerase
VRAQGFDTSPWPHDFGATMTFRFSETLGMRLEIQNREASPVQFECALHTYFAISDVRDVRVEGFADESWKQSKGGESQKQNGDITFGEPVNRIFSGSGPARIHDANRTLLIDEREGWRSTIVWNPGASLNEQNAEDWRRFVCVEAGAIDDRAVTLAPGDSYALDIEIALA